MIKNIDNLQQIWLERCDAIENNQKGSYSRHLLLILHDLREEIQKNKDRFSKNAYGKKFFKIQFSTYCSFKKEQVDDLDKIRKSWTREVNQELYFITDDVYNIYRIRNMLAHSSSTTSRLFDYYAKRSREYCHSLLDAIAYKIYQTSNDDEIMPLEFYFREMVIDANIALEAVKYNKMDKFINWALS